MSPKFLIGIGSAFLLIFALGVAAVVLSDPARNPQTIASTQPANPAPVATATAAPPSVQSVAEAPAVPQNAEPFTPVTVQNSDIDQLATAVKLGDSKTGDVGKDIWARETPVAKRLLQGLCDCDQRNWLNHFVKTGNEAINGSENYYQSVQLLSKLRRSNADLVKQQAPR